MTVSDSESESAAAAAAFDSDADAFSGRATDSHCGHHDHTSNRLLTELNFKLRALSRLL